MGDAAAPRPDETLIYGSTRLTTASEMLSASNALTIARDTSVPEAPDNDSSADDLMRRKWRSSPYAVGLTQPTWQDEKVTCCQSCDSFRHFTSFVCAKCPVGRVGNMVLLHAAQEEREEDRTIPPPPRLRWIVGPYWPVPLCLTLPLVVVYSIVTFRYSESLHEHLYLIIPWAILNAVTLISLFLVSCSDPGILRRHTTAPASSADDDWVWNDQALTFRPRHARYDPECGVVIQRFDHTCPWTGTAIGQDNMKYFRIFVPAMFGTMIFNTVVFVYI